MIGNGGEDEDIMEDKQEKIAEDCDNDDGVD